MDSPQSQLRYMSILQSYMQSSYDHCIFVGDFNFPDNEMLAKHPQSLPPPCPTVQALTPVQITAEGVIKTLEASDRTAHEMHFEVRRLSHGTRTDPTTFLLAGEKGSSAEVRYNSRREMASTLQVDYPQQGKDGTIGLVRGGTEHCFLIMVGPKAGRTRSRATLKGLRGLDPNQAGCRSPIWL